jgi:hypothetical protein
MAPLLDPCKYFVGKYDHNDPSLFNLPSIPNNNVHPKLLEENNSSYVDGFFVFLTSLLLNNKNFIHGLDYYGSFLSIKKNYKINIIDDLEYLNKSDFFNKHKNVLFHIPEYSHLMYDDCEMKLQPIQIHNGSQKSISNISVCSINDELFENIFEKENHVNLGDLNETNIELLDITELKYFQIKDNCPTTLKSSSTCSSRTSHTVTSKNGEDCDNLENESLTNSNGNTDDLISDDSSNENNMNDEENEENEENEEEENEEEENENDDDEYETDESSEPEEFLEATIPKFPVQVICMENCESTFDDLIINNELSTDEWFSAFMQIIMILITYQKLFSFSKLQDPDP